MDATPRPLGLKGLAQKKICGYRYLLYTLNTTVLIAKNELTFVTTVRTNLENYIEINRSHVEMCQGRASRSSLTSQTE